jgi:hypothetical protein
MCRRVNVTNVCEYIARELFTEPYAEQDSHKLDLSEVSSSSRHNPKIASGSKHGPLKGKVRIRTVVTKDVLDKVLEKK